MADETLTPGDLDPVIHERARLLIASALASRRSLDWLELKALLTLTDGNLSAHVAVLERAGYISVEKGYAGKKPRTVLRLTTPGRRAFARHVAALERLLFPDRRRP